MRLVVTGGGTGGHIYPALAIARYAKTRVNAEALYIGTVRGLEHELAPRTGISCRFIEVEGLRRKASLRAVKTVWLAVTAVFAARKELKAFRPTLVVGTGGYVVAPVIMAAYSLGIPTAILEMDARAGLANRMVSRIVDVVMLAMAPGAKSFPNAKHVVVTGNPRASEAIASARAGKEVIRQELGLTKRPIVTIVSGSRGASPINEAVIAWLGQSDFTDYQVVWVTGQTHFEQVQSRLRQFDRSLDHVQILPYFHEMPALLSLSTLAISRAGATILAELTALGVPSVLIPSPYVTHRHQDDNAQTLVDAGAAILLPEEDLNAMTLQEKVEGLLRNPFRLESMKKSSLALGHPDALDKVMDILLATVKKPERKR